MPHKSHIQHLTPSLQRKGYQEYTPEHLSGHPNHEAALAKENVAGEIRLLAAMKDPDEALSWYLADLVWAHFPDGTDELLDNDVEIQHLESEVWAKIGLQPR